MRNRQFLKSESASTSPPKKSGGSHSKKGQTSAITVNKKTLSKMNREISSMKAKLKGVTKAKRTSSNDEDSDVQDNAGDQFGGRKKKKQKKADQQD